MGKKYVVFKYKGTKMESRMEMQAARTMVCDKLETVEEVGLPLFVIPQH